MPDPLDTQNLNELVRQYQSAAEQQNQQRCADLYATIKQRCEPTTNRIHNKYRQLGSFVEDTFEDKLASCLERFPGSGDFRWYLSRALLNSANSEWARQARTRPMGDTERLASSPQPAIPEADLVEQAEDYATRKRWLIDQLKLRPKHKYSTLLLDQRCRMSGIVGDGVDRAGKEAPSQWVERHERWHENDPQLPLDDPESPAIGTVWDCFARRVDKCPNKVEQPMMVAAIADTQTWIALATWRKRVSRYLRDVQEQTSEPEFRFFLTRERN